jgi:hypothetical protein
MQVKNITISGKNGPVIKKKGNNITENFMYLSIVDLDKRPSICIG